MITMDVEGTWDVRNMSIRQSGIRVGGDEEITLRHMSIR